MKKCSYLTSLLAGLMILLLTACGGGSGGGSGGDSSSSSETDSPTFGGATAIEAVSTSTETIGIVDDSGTDTAIIVFEIRDAAAVIVPDGRRVDFTMPLHPMGGETLSVTEAYTSNGQVTVELRSGTTSGPVDVKASYYDEETGQTLIKVVRVTIVSGISDYTHLTMAVKVGKHSLDNSLIGDETTITAYLGDRYGNVIQDGTPVSFMTEGGTIGLSSGFETTTTSGAAQAALRVTNPRAPELDGPVPYGNPGFCRVVAYTSGSESFNDIDGDGVYDESVDEFIDASDLSEPYLDENDNDEYDSGELYIDSDGNKEFTAKNDVYDFTTTIWKSMNITFSSGLNLFVKKSVCDEYFDARDYVDGNCAVLKDDNFIIGTSDSESFKFIIYCFYFCFIVFV